MLCEDLIIRRGVIFYQFSVLERFWPKFSAPLSQALFLSPHHYRGALRALFLRASKTEMVYELMESVRKMFEHVRPVRPDEVILERALVGEK